MRQGTVPRFMDPPPVTYTLVFRLAHTEEEAAGECCASLFASGLSFMFQHPLQQILITHGAVRNREADMNQLIICAFETGDGSSFHT